MSIANQVKSTSPVAVIRMPRNSKPTYKIASSCNELVTALRLVYQVYLRSGLIEANLYQMRVTPFHSLPTTKVLIATNRDETLCTLSVIGDGQLGLPMETIYPEQIATRRKQGISFVEISCLADKEHGHQKCFSIVSRLMALTAQCAKHHNVDQLLITVHPRHTMFYERFLCFKIIGEEKAYPLMRNHPAIAMMMDLNTIKCDHPRVYQRLFGTPFDKKTFQHRPIPPDLQLDLRTKAANTYEDNSVIND
jgi:hypothetical protein